MTVCFNEKIIVKTFDDKYYDSGEHNIYHLKLRRCKDFDGPNNFSILWNQLLILTIHNIIHDTSTLKDKFNLKILKLYKKEILKEINTILYKFTELKLNSITIYYNNYSIHNNKDNIKDLTNLYQLIDEL